MTISFDRLLLTFLELTEIPVTIANIVDAKVKNAVLNTVAKITQLFPIACFYAAYLGDKVYDAIHWHGLPPYPWNGTKAEKLAWEKIAEIMFGRTASAAFWRNVVFYTAGALILAIPVVFKFVHIAATRFHWDKTRRILDATEKTLMTMVKIANIVAVVWGLVASCSIAYPLGIVAFYTLLALNGWATVSYVWPHRSNASQVSQLKTLPT